MNEIPAPITLIFPVLSVFAKSAIKTDTRADSAIALIYAVRASVLMRLVARANGFEGLLATNEPKD